MTAILCEYREMQEAVALGIAIASGNFERGTGLIPQSIFNDLYANGLLTVHYDQWGEPWVSATEEGESRYAEILGGDVADI